MRAELKRNAKTALARYYWAGVLVQFAYTTLAGMSDQSLTAIRITVKVALSGALDSEACQHLMTALATRTGLLLPVSLALTIFVINPLTIGLNRFFLESRLFTSSISTLFYAFSSGRYWRCVKVMAAYTIKLLLWLLLLFIPGVIRNYEYYLIPFLLAENPSLPVKRYFALSKALMAGEKAKVFLFDLSFSGWIFFSCLLCGIGIVFVLPYITAAQAEYYALMRAKAFATGAATPRELNAFNPTMRGWA